MSRTPHVLYAVNKYDICEGSENIPIHFIDDNLIPKLQNFQYVCCNIPGPGTDRKLFEDVIEGCVCDEVSCNTSPESSCGCVQLSLSSQYKSGLNKSLEQNISTVECNSLCSCTNICNNKVVQNGIRHQMEVFEDPNKGFGLRTLEAVKKNAFVCEYAGEVLTAEEVKGRFKLQIKNGIMNYIFALNEHFPTGLQTTYVDPRLRGSIGRFLNHSCDPCLFMVPVRAGNFVPKLCLFAKRDIEAGEELTYSYGEYRQTPASTDKACLNLITCKCGSSNCLGFLPFDDSI